MVERDINFGSSETDAKYQISDDGAPGNFVLARDTNGNTVLLQWNATAGQWEYGGPVDMVGNDLVDAGTTVYDASTDTVGDGTTSADHTAVTTGDGTFNQSVTYPGGLTVTADPVGWEEDANSPQTETATASSTYTLSGTYDFVMVFMDVDEVAGTNSELDLRVNGDTGSNYIYRNADGTRTVGTTQIDKFGFVPGNFYTQYQFLFSGRWSGDWDGGRVETGSGNEAIGMKNTNVTSPLDSFTVLDSDSENIDVAFEVYGRDIASAGEP